VRRVPDAKWDGAKRCVPPKRTQTPLSARLAMISRSTRARSRWP
jgi:hypothetical protein